MATDMGELLRRCGMFRWLTAPSLAKLTQMARNRRFPATELIFRQESPCPGLFVVIDGLVRVYRVAPDGREHVLHMVGPGGTFAEVAAIADFPAPACASAISASRCVLLPADALRQALADDHELCLQLLKGMALWVRHLVGLLEDITLRDAVGRVARHLLQRADTAGVVRLPRIKRHLASHLNLTSETLSRTLRKLIAAAAITEGPAGKLQLTDRAALAAAADGQFPHL